MPTFERLPRFVRDFDALSANQQRQFVIAVEKFVADLRTGEGFRAGLRVKGVRGAAGVFELTWADDGRATFSVGETVREREPHVVWRRVGTHDVLGRP